MKTIPDIVREDIHWLLEYESFTPNLQVWAHFKKSVILGKIINIRYDNSIKKPQFQIQTTTQVFLTSKVEKLLSTDYKTYNIEVRSQNKTLAVSRISDNLLHCLIAGDSVGVLCKLTDQEYVAEVVEINIEKTECLLDFTLSKELPFKNGIKCIRCWCATPKNPSPTINNNLLIFKHIKFLGVRK